MKPELLWVLLWMQISKGVQSICTKSSCPVGYDCDTNTGFCRQFRQPVNSPAISTCPLCLPGYQCNQRTGRCEAAYYQASPCDGVICPTGFECDDNTGICRQFRAPNTAPALTGCANQVCMTGYECDPDTNTCLPTPKSPLFTDLCSGVDCPNGFRCDSNTGNCVAFRAINSAPVIREDKCAGVNCPSGYFCDTNTGLCRASRIPSSVSKCSGVTCPVGQQCDSNTGLCRSFRVPSSNLCLGVTCPAGQQCDTSTGICRPFRVPSDSKCSGITCPAGQQCDTNTGICRSFRTPSGSSAIVVPRDTDKCRGMICASGYYCDEKNGLCRPSRIPGKPVLPEGDISPCANVRCPEAMACDSNTGLCRSFRTSLEALIPLPSVSFNISQTSTISNISQSEPSKCGVCANGTRCDENTGTCRPFRTPMRFAKLLQRYAELCHNVTCQPGFSCVSGSCEPSQGKTSCEGIVCDDDEFCEPETGKCEKFNSTEQVVTEPTTTPQSSTTEATTTTSSTTTRSSLVLTDKPVKETKNKGKTKEKVVDDACTKVKCGYGKICDSTSGKCLTLRAVIESELLALRIPESTKDRCANVVCFEGLQCNRETGDCVAMRQIEPVNLCLLNRIKCLPNFVCDSSSGKCLAVVDEGKAMTNYPLSYTIGRDPCLTLVCPENTRCDSATGRCVVNAILPHSTPIVPSKNSKHSPVDLCWNVNCPEGTNCDSNSGACRPVRIVQKDDHSNLCNGMKCPAGQKCDQSSGNCIVFRYVDLCEGIRCDNDYFCLQGNCVFRDVGCGPEPCPIGSKCDPLSRTCTVFRDEQISKKDLCLNVTCNESKACDPKSGTCKEVSCPQHSHFVQCGSPCPFTCNNLDKCNDPCVPTCQCDDGYVQIRRTEVQCVLASVCRRTIDPCEEANDCDSNDVCIDGMCQPKACPGIRKSALRPGCNYVLQRGTNNCLQLNTVC